MSKQLTSEQRYAIYLGLARKQSKKHIAQEIGVHPSTVTREVQRNSNRDKQYVFTVAQQKCDSRKHNNLGNHHKDPILWWRVEQMIMDEDWSPRQISGVLAKEGIHICPQTIYNHVHADTTGKLVKHMPHELCYRRRQKKRRPTKATNIPNRTSIHERPKEADGTRFGDWEMDLIVDRLQHVILTLVERSTNMLLMERIRTGKKAEPIANAVARLLMPYSDTIKTIQRTMVVSSPRINLLQNCSIRKGKKMWSCILRMPTPRGKKGALRTQINLFENTSLSEPILTDLTMHISRKFRRN